jgi:Bifunctional DNA primase/polymerase, N-terminal/Protein of unknown function (DUF3631)
VTARIHNPESESTNKLLTAALDYAARDWFVFPVHSVRDGVCTCGRTDCRNVAKHPCIKGWQHNASKDPDQIKRWWTKWPDANVGIACGPSRLIVLDEDIGHGGAESLASLERQHGPLPATMIVNSGGGGHHFYFRRNGTEIRNSAGVLGPGLDIRGDGGFIVASPSRHRSGNRYEIQESSPDPALIPDWVVEDGAKSKKKSKNAKPAEPIKTGERHDRLTELGGRLIAHGKGKWAVIDAMLYANAQGSDPWSEAEVIDLGEDLYKRYAKQPVFLLPMTDEERAQMAHQTATLLNTIKAELHKYLILSVPAAIVMAVWTLHTFVFEVAIYTLYLNVTAPEKRSGKSRVLEVLAWFVARPWLSGGATAAVLKHKIDRDLPTLLHDETQSAFSDKDAVGTLIGILCNGFHRGMNYTSMSGQGAAMYPREFRVFSPKAFAGLGDYLPDTVLDRSIDIPMKRKKKAESVTPLEAEVIERETDEHQRSIRKWAAQVRDRLREFQPDRPPEFHDRQWDCSKLLLQIADMAGLEWGKKTRAALVELFTGEAVQDDSTGVQLLQHIYTAFAELKPIDGRISTSRLLQKLNSNEEWPWAVWYESRGRRPDQRLDDRGLAALLWAYRIKPNTLRIADEGRMKGYAMDQFKDAWERYLP